MATTINLQYPLTLKDLQSAGQHYILINSYESKNLNESLIKGINIGLNDKIAFTKSLFDGSEEDYSRVVSQLQTCTSLDEAFNFLENILSRLMQTI